MESAQHTDREAAARSSIDSEGRAWKDSFTWVYVLKQQRTRTRQVVC